MTAHPLAVLRYRSNRAIDGVFEPLADEVGAAVLRRGVADGDGGLVLDGIGAALVLGDIRRAMDRTRAERAAILLAVKRDAGRLGEGGNDGR